MPGRLPFRGDARDALVTRAGDASLAGLEPGSTVGTASARRTAFLRAVRADLRVVPLAGDVERRLDEHERTHTLKHFSQIFV